MKNMILIVVHIYITIVATGVVLPTPTTIDEKDCFK